MAVMEPRDLSRDPFCKTWSQRFTSCLGLEVAGLEILNISKKWFGKISIINDFCLLYFQVRNNQNLSENARNLKKIQLGSDNNIQKNFSTMHKF